MEVERFNIFYLGDCMVEKLVAIMQDLHGFSFHRGTLSYDSRLDLSSKSILISTMLQEFHNTPQEGRFNFNMDYGIENYIKILTKNYKILWGIKY